MLMSIVLAIVDWKVWRASLSHSFRLQTEQGSGKFVSTICETFNSLVGLKTICFGSESFFILNIIKFKNLFTLLIFFAGL